MYVSHMNSRVTYFDNFLALKALLHYRCKCPHELLDRFVKERRFVEAGREL